ncbi:hypothetical protein V1273_004738 [Bradyrhizobium sp. AZCC 1721]
MAMVCDALSGKTVDRTHQIRRTKRLLQTDDVGKFWRFGQKVQRGHSRNRNDRQVRHAGAHRCNQIGAVSALQKDVDDRKVEARIFEQLQCGCGAVCLDDFKTMDTQHDRNHRADVGLIVNNKHAGHRSLPGRSHELTTRIRGFGGSAVFIRPVGKEVVTSIGFPAVSFR